MTRYAVLLVALVLAAGWVLGAVAVQAVQGWMVSTGIGG